MPDGDVVFDIKLVLVASAEIGACAAVLYI
jgi:hypothetical protein